MREELFYKPDVLFTRLAQAARERARVRRLRGTCAENLKPGHIHSLELVEILRSLNIRCVYDVGANVGTWTLLAKAVLPEANVEAFEPYLPHIEEFSRQTGALKDVRMHAVGLGSETGIMPLRVTRYTDASSILAPADGQNPELRETQRVDVHVWRLDEYRLVHALPDADLIKLDVQGFEVEALKGAIKTLERARAIISEASFVQFYERQCYFEDLVTFLAENGFGVAAFGEQTLTATPIQQTDVLFLRRERRDPLSS